MSQADAVFTEVLDISIDTESFVAGLAQLESAYTEFLARIQNAGEGVNLGGVAASSLIQLNESVSELQNSFTAFDAEVTSAFTDVDSQLKSLQGSIESTSQAAINAKASIASQQTGAPASPAVAPVAGGLGSVPGQIASAQTGMAGLISQMAQFRLLWSAIGEVIQVAVDIIESPFEVIKTGFEYLSKLQDQAASLQGPIAANAAYSKDLGVNFEKAGVAAKEVALEFQQMSVKLGVPATELEHIFSDVLESGGLHFVKTMQDVVSLTELFSVAMSKVSTDTEVQRRVMLEIPGLLNGTESANARILNVLGLTKAQWEQIRIEAQAHGDLVEKLSGLMAPYLSVVEQADQRQSRLLEGIRLQSQIIAGAIALPLWQQFTGILQSVSGFIDKNAESLKQVGLETVDLTKEFVLFVGEIAAGLTGTTSLHSVFQSVLETVNNLVGALRIAIETTSTWGRELGVIAQFAGDPFNFASPKAISDFNAKIGVFEKNYTDKIKEIYQQGQTVARGFNVNTFFDENGQFKGAPNLTNNILNNQVSPNKGLPDPTAEKAAAKEREDAFRTTQETFRTELEKTKQAFVTTEADIKAKQETGTLSVHEATLQRVAAIQTELDAIQKLVQKYTELASKSGAKPTEIQKFDATLTDVSNAASSSASVQTTGALAQDQANAEHVTQAHEERLRQMAIEHSRTMIEIYKQEALAGIITKTELFDKETALAKQEQDAVLSALSAELTNAGSNEAAISAINDRITAANQKYTDKTVEFSRIRLASIAQESLQLERDKLKEQQLQGQTEQITAKASARGSQAASQISSANTDVAAKHLLAANAALADAQALERYAVALGITGAALEKYKIQVADAAKNQATATEEARQAELNSPIGQESQKVFGTGIASIHEAFDGFGTSVQSLGNAMQVFGKGVAGFIGAIKSGYAQGGVAGAIGGGASEAGSFLSSLGPAFGPAGSIISGVGQIFSLLGGLFTAHAKKIADDIQKAVSDLMNQYSNGQATLVQTITSLQQERQDAINQLSGQKGGQDQLNKILPQLDNQIAQLKQQQLQVKTTFEQSLAVLQTHSQTIGQILSTWQQINKQVTDYLNAGGDAAKAAQFLSLSLQQQLQTTQTSLNDAEQQAISDATNLNSLLLQRVDLAKQFAQQEFSLKNQDALERMANPAVNAALNYQQQKAANDAQLTALDQQIQLYTSRVDMEKQVFNLAQSTADLQAQSNALNLAALAQTIQGWQDLQKIVASITESSSGLFSLNPNLFNAPIATGTTNSKTINVGTVNVVTQATNAPSIAAALAKELSLVGSYGANTSYI